MQCSPYLENPRPNLRSARLDDYTKERTVDGFSYRLRGSYIGFTVYPFCGSWRATNGSRSVHGSSEEIAAIKFLEGVR